MASSSQRKATASHRRRAAARGLVRVEVPDEVFEGVFEQGRGTGWRDVEL